MPPEPSLIARRSIGGGSLDEQEDPRVSAVLEVLSGRATAAVARQRSVDPGVLHRWVRDFVEAGTAQVTNRPVGDAAHQRDRFLAAFAHEVRTPLASARGWVEMLVDDDLPAGCDVAVERMRVALDRLEERTIDVQLMASASMGRVRLTPSRCRVGDLVDRLPGPPLVGGHGPEVEVVVDAELFPRIVHDLWEAAEHEPTPRSVRLVVTAEPRHLELRVERDGEPIEPEILQALFEPFDLNDDATGITIGLYLARALAVAHGGTIGVEQDDRGAVFWLRIPQPGPVINHAHEE